MCKYTGDNKTIRYNAMNLHTIYIYGNWIVNVYERLRTLTIENDDRKSQRLQLTFPVLYGLIRTSDTVAVLVTVVVSGECLRYRFTMVVIHRNSSFTTAVTDNGKRLSFPVVIDRYTAVYDRG